MTGRALCFATILFSIPTSGVFNEAFGEVAKEEVGQACMQAIADQAETVRVYKRIGIKENGIGKELILLRGSFAGSGNGTLLALVREEKKCRLVLTTEARGVEAKFRKGRPFPDLETYFSEGKDDAGIMITDEETYVWDGKEYREKKRTSSR